MLRIKINTVIKDVKPGDWFSKNDLFVIVKYNNLLYRTTTRWNNNRPEWNETFLFDYDEDINEIEVKLCDDDKWSKDEILLTEKIYMKEDFCNLQIGLIDIEYEKVEVIGVKTFQQMQKQMQNMNQVMGANGILKSKLHKVEEENQKLNQKISDIKDIIV